MDLQARSAGEAGVPNDLHVEVAHVGSKRKVEGPGERGRLRESRGATRIENGSRGKRENETMGQVGGIGSLERNVCPFVYIFLLIHHIFLHSFIH